MVLSVVADRECKNFESAGFANDQKQCMIQTDFFRRGWRCIYRRNRAEQRLCAEKHHCHSEDLSSEKRIVWYQMFPTPGYRSHISRNVSKFREEKRQKKIQTKEASAKRVLKADNGD